MADEPDQVKLYHRDPFIRGPGTMWIAPVGTPFPPIEQGDPGEDWALVHPRVPDYPPR